jgi:O-antigen/teichoic acid export membrane protein
LTGASSKPAAAGGIPDPLAGGSAQLFWAKIAGNGGYFVAVLFVARGLGPGGRGTVAFITVTALVVAHVAGLGVGEATTVLAARRRSLRPTLLANAVLFCLLSGLVAAGLAVTGLLFGEVGPAGVGTPELLILGLGIVACAAGEAGYSFLLGVERLRQLAVVTGVTSWVYAGLVLLLTAGPGLTVGRAAMAWTATEGLRAVILISLSNRATQLGRPLIGLLRESIAFGLRLWIGSLARFLNFRTDQILMGFIASEAALGFYAVAVNASEVLLYLPSSAATALLPLIARTEREHRAEATLKAFRSVVFVTAAGVAVAALLGPIVLPAIFGEDFEESVEPFLWLLPGTFGFAASSVFSNALVGSSAPSLSSLGPMVSLIVGFALDLLLIPRFGATGAAVAATVAFLAGGATALAAYRRLSPFAWRDLLVPHRGDLDLLRALAGPLLRLPTPRRGSP